MVNPIQELVHEHRELSGLLVALHEALSRVERGKSTLSDELHEMRDAIEAFRETLLEHFASEQQGVLPFVVVRLPALSGQADQLIEEHDRIAESLTAVVKNFGAVEAGEPIDAWRKALSAFEDLYAAHTKSELRFLEDVAKELSDDRAAMEQLRALFDES